LRFIHNQRTTFEVSSIQSRNRCESRFATTHRDEPKSAGPASLAIATHKDIENFAELRERTAQR